MPRARRFKGFGVLDEAGNLIWGSLRCTRANAEDWARDHNPDVTGHRRVFRVVAVDLRFEDQP